MEQEFRKVPRYRRLFNKLPKPIKNNIKIIKRRYFKKIKLPKNTYEGGVSKSVVVLGVPRSGTSLIGKILSKLGVYMSEDEHIRMPGNAQGFFESKYFADMDDKILAISGGVWNDIPKEEKILRIKNNPKINEEIKRIIRSQEKKIWGWKGTRTCLTADMYHPHLKNPHYILVYRNLLSTSRSIEKGGKIWGKTNLIESMNLALTYNKRLLNFLSRINSPVLFISYENLLDKQEQKKEVEKIKKFLNIKRNITLEFIDKKLRTC